MISYRPLGIPFVLVASPLLLLLALPDRGRPDDGDGSAFEDGFDVAGTIEEAGSPESSRSPDWWVSSGAWLRREDGVGRTVQGALPSGDRWRKAYAAANPLDTENGRRPQNVFRIVTRERWEDVEQQLWFRVTRTNLTDSPNRDAWNGVQLFLRYQDAATTYTAGLRVDGKAAIKRKHAGRYTTLAATTVYPGAYDRAARPNVLPEGRWIGLRAASRTTKTGSVALRLDVEDPAVGPGWVTVLEIEDRSEQVIRAPGSGGLRTDFMDVELEGYAAFSDEALPGEATPTATATTPPATPTPRPTATATATAVPTATPETASTPKATPTRKPKPIVRVPSRPFPPRFPW